ncbi:GT4 family glycosyltransferase PelF [Novosphingobium sp. KCTC 2891]|uniref:GT4 family glycosyltransferase PelF n=1 Tax=Novosphingobium sp. KCTC 2891 TaxID=2989730 RepID=UPI0022238C97|nr:GT4 family glycosyltransferase PelF [Novosphingobium sp. KCTC 2891]MCW1381896.1 GT4 family glycosyltransferase PelF [Novosphingobium sp. KCTC 2891]
MTEPARESDVCVIVEGAYPYVTGGVASWLQELITSLPDITFSVLAIKADEHTQPWHVTPPPNVIEIVEVPLSFAPRRPAAVAPRIADRIGRLLHQFLETGAPDLLRSLNAELGALRPTPRVGDIMSSPEMFAILSGHYRKAFPSASFHHFFWATRILLGGLLAVLLAPLPRARIYHTLSTGFAGLLAARATYETGRPAFLTEHGIYLLERQIEIMMAEWMGDQTETGLVLAREHHDLRDLWSAAFESYAHGCYDACSPIIALYGANSEVQARLGAQRDRLRVIPNGIRPERFADVVSNRDEAKPLIALIGRVVPIKDIKTFIRAAALVHAAFPQARFAVLGPKDEDADYAADCDALVAELGMEDVIAFPGRVNVVDWMPQIDILVLTSLSEAQPLVILEAGACGIPSVAPDVGSCRELIEGTSPGARHGGIITALVDPEATSTALLRLLRDPALRAEMGQAMQDRVHADYDWSGIVAQYRRIYTGSAESVAGNEAGDTPGASAPDLPPVRPIEIAPVR